MSRDKQQGPGPRDTSLARLIAAALDTRPPATGKACPDADLLAAYADRSLKADEMAHLETHFADCPRCQRVLAILTVSAEDPLSQQEIARLGELAGRAAPVKEPIPRASEDDKATKRLRTWRWLVPALGLAAAAALIFALRPASLHLGPEAPATAQKSAPAAQPDQATQMAQAEVPPAPAKNMASLDHANAGAITRGAETQQKKDAVRDETGQIAPTPSNSDREGAVAAALPPPPEGQRQAVTVTGETSPSSDVAGGMRAATRQSSVAPRAQAAPEALAEPNSSLKESATNGPTEEVPLAGRNAVVAMAKVAIQPHVFAAPDGGVQWRIGAGGSIERSTDQGKTWQAERSGATSDLTAGAAPSDKVAWIVGRADVILRTTDGEHWQRVSPPEPVAKVGGTQGSADWAGIEALDALHATVSSTDGQRYKTSDGGNSWTLLP